MWGVEPPHQKKLYARTKFWNNLSFKLAISQKLANFHLEDVWFFGISIKKKWLFPLYSLTDPPPPKMAPTCQMIDLGLLTKNHQGYRGLRPLVQKLQRFENQNKYLEFFFFNFILLIFFFDFLGHSKQKKNCSKILFGT